MKTLTMDEIADLYYDQERMGLINNLECFYRVFQVSPEWAMNTWGSWGVIYLELITSLVGTGIHVKDIKIISIKKETSDFSSPNHIHIMSYLTHIKMLSPKNHGRADRWEVQFSFNCDLEEFRKLEFYLRVHATTFIDAELNMDEIFGYNGKYTCVIKFSN